MKLSQASFLSCLFLSATTARAGQLGTYVCPSWNENHQPILVSLNLDANEIAYVLDVPGSTSAWTPIFSKVIPTYCGYQPDSAKNIDCGFFSRFNEETKNLSRDLACEKKFDRTSTQVTEGLLSFNVKTQSGTLECSFRDEPKFYFDLSECQKQ